MSKPVLIVVDPWGKALNDAEAAGYVDYGDFMKPEVKKKFKEVGKGSNFGHAKFAQAQARRWAVLTQEFNVTIILIHHQNDNLDGMAEGTSPSFKPSYMSPTQKALRNNTHNGGHGLGQLASLTLIMAGKGDYKNPLTKEVEGKRVSLRVEKNSHGAHNRTIDYILRDNHLAHDVYADGRLVKADPPLDFDTDFAKLLLDKGWLAVRATDGLYTCEELGLNKVPPRVLGEAINSNEAMVTRLACLLEIDGYDSTGDVLLQAAAEQMKARKLAEAMAAPPEAASEESEEEDEDDGSE